MITIGPENGRADYVFLDGSRFCPHEMKSARGETFPVPDAVGNIVIHRFSDFLLDAVGTGHGIVRAGPRETANNLRTITLWDLRMQGTVHACSCLSYAR